MLLLREESGFGDGETCFFGDDIFDLLCLTLKTTDVKDVRTALELSNGELHILIIAICFDFLQIVVVVFKLFRELHASKVGHTI